MSSNPRQLLHPNDIELEYESSSSPSSSSSSSQPSGSEEQKEAYYQHVVHDLRILSIVYDDLLSNLLPQVAVDMKKLDFIATYDTESEKVVPSRNTLNALNLALNNDHRIPSSDPLFTKAVKMMDYLYEWRVEMGIIWGYMQRLTKRITERTALHPSIPFILNLFRVNDFSTFATKIRELEYNDNHINVIIEPLDEFNKEHDALVSRYEHSHDEMMRALNEFRYHLATGKIHLRGIHNGTTLNYFVE